MNKGNCVNVSEVHRLYKTSTTMYVRCVPASSPLQPVVPGELSSLLTAFAVLSRPTHFITPPIKLLTMSSPKTL